MDIDSVDLLRFAIALSREFGADVPEADYPKLGTLGGCVSYFAARGAQESNAAPPPAS